MYNYCFGLNVISPKIHVLKAWSLVLAVQIGCGFLRDDAYYKVGGWLGAPPSEGIDVVLMGPS
jgi:hypothetical protein